MLKKKNTIKQIGNKIQATKRYMTQQTLFISKSCENMIK